jgi:MFS family permease
VVPQGGDEANRTTEPLVLPGLGHHGTAQEAPIATDGLVFGDTGRALPAPSGLRRYIGYQLVSSFRLTGAIWVIFLADRGLSLGQIGLAEAAFHLAPVTLELPTGSLADLFGRKWSLAMGSLLGVISALLMLAVHQLWLAIPAMYLAGAAMTFESGAQQAFLYDALAAGGGSDRFSRVFGRLISAGFLVTGVSAFLGGALADQSFVWPYALAAGIGLIGVWLAVGLQEPARERATHRSIGRTIGEALATVRERPRLGAMLLFGAIFWTSVTLAELYAQAVFDGMGLPPSRIGLLVGGSFVMVAAGAWLAHRLTSRGTFTVWTIGLSLLTVGGVLGIASEVLPLAIVAFVLFEFGTGIYEPLLADRINREVEASRRATILSLNGFLFSLTMIWAFPLVGWVAGRAGWLVAFSGVSVVLLASLVIWLLSERGAVED